MKRITIILFLATLVWPCMSQTAPERREKKHSPFTSIFKAPEVQRKSEKQDARFEFFNAGILALKNNARADSMLAYNSMYKNGEWELFAKEIPTYLEGTNLIESLEIWYSEGYGKDYFPAEKMVASYDENETLTRVEYHFWNNNGWKPNFAYEMLFDKYGDEVYYAEYYYEEDASEWIIDYGFRAVDEYNENNVLILRIWEYYDDWDNIWIPDEKEEYILNENDIIVEIIFYWYDDWDETWEKETRMVMELDENNTWESGYGYFWDEMEEEWIPQLKYMDFEWVNFELLQFSNLMVFINADFSDDFEDWKANPKEEIEWLNYMKLNMDYTDEGLITLVSTTLWDHDEEDWTIIMENKTVYDHFLNIIHDSFSVYDGNEWELLFGYQLDMVYNENESIHSFVFSYFMEDWKNEFIPAYRYEFYYPKDETSAPVVIKPEPLKVYPNPASSGLNLVWTGKDEVIDITILGIDGKVLARYDKHPVIPGEAIMLDVSHLKKGIYFVHTQGKQNHQVTRFIKN